MYLSYLEKGLYLEFSLIVRERMKLIFILLVIFLVALENPARAEVDYSGCGFSASQLASAASEVERQKMSYEGACDPYIGYLKDDRGACGPYGYERSGYESAVRDFQSARSSVDTSCGVDNQILRLLQRSLQENKQLKEKLQKLRMK
jgi:hypothetical protein